ncbi:Predicted flavoprotein CzcO associated with the cation diffusion facilitator CzcD [Cribrihabitans marinus]|uniref:Predicted flavoprotein CzcO associated with the cation diffusion facilitator CzcD n=1 Tax=Cribrihabitans marinus TaxID=1227549 RepID=A0A1H6SAH8_9RHOB|nr:NAD(P)/FAD-dependent oxidoreductase [Cribrihabitans marinus]GGH23969.1 4-hydroxyacetophenone monooxygenase [Cribrihabitans marinus]SEI62914.1 Predicted flavoprotein CzcO associated with the cation diffusion facilitator CzcD [Cribrihabitans marinus]
MTTDHQTEMLIIGAGFSGLLMAIEARRRGVKEITILERAGDVGGTWRENTYPGVACDVPSHLYSMAGHPNPNWTRAYAGGAEIQAYLQSVARREGLYELCRFHCAMTRARWQNGRWQVETSDGHRWSTRFLVSAIGALHVPLVPDIPGRDAFPGPAFHSAEWDHAARIAGKRVAVVGTGASAVQFVPEIAGTAAHVTVFQRTAPYVLPRPDGPIPERVRRLYRAVPPLRQLRRALIYAIYEMRHAVFRGQPHAVTFAMKMWRKGLERAITDPHMRARLTPDYRIGCKRILSSNDWYPTLARDDVTLVASGVDRIEGRTLVAQDGRRVDADVLIWGTGFRVTDAAERLDVTGAGGRTLREAWSGGMQAHLGTAIAGFPNLFLLLGPHTGLGHNSVVLMIEAQVGHVGRLLADMERKGLTAIAPCADAQAGFEAEMADRLAGSVWQDGGCRSWYQDAAGRNPTIWPGTVGAFRRRMKRAGLEQYEGIE